MNDTLEIKKDAAIKAYSQANGKSKTLLENLFGVKVFQKGLIERITCFDDVCIEMGADPKNFICTSENPIDIMINALRKWILAAEYFNEGKEPDWSNSNQSKYIPWYKFSAGSGWSVYGVAYWHTGTGAYCGSRQYFLNKTHVEHCVKVMPEIFIDFIKHS
jgi:uncharacterized protein YlzI (FlbEa/FlbD family)